MGGRGAGPDLRSAAERYEAIRQGISIGLRHRGQIQDEKNDDWTNGFWTGMLWMAFLYTGDQVFKELALEHVKSFDQRLKDHFILDHHDIGFLYSPSVAAAWRVTGTGIWSRLLSGPQMCWRAVSRKKAASSRHGAKWGRRKNTGLL